MFLFLRLCERERERSQPPCSVSDLSLSLSVSLSDLQEKADLGELNFSLCYLPTAGRLTATIIKATNLKAMDLTGFSGKGLTRRHTHIMLL